VPNASPVTTPETGSIGAIAGAELVQVPPGTPLVRVAVLPIHRVRGPPIGVGADVTVTIFVAIQLVPNVYVIVDVPNATPVTIPVVKPTVATAVLLLVQVPPGTASLNVVEEDTPVTPIPVIGAGIGITVTAVVTLQPEPIE
jgi:hypothetical protein